MKCRTHTTKLSELAANISTRDNTLKIEKSQSIKSFPSTEELTRNTKLEIETEQIIL